MTADLARIHHFNTEKQALEEASYQSSDFSMPKCQTSAEALLEKVNLRAFLILTSHSDNWDKKERRDRILKPSFERQQSSEKQED